MTSPLRVTGNIDFRTNVSPDFEIINLAASVDEGQSISPTIGATSKWNNLLVDVNRVYWEISGVGIASTDFSSVGADGNPDAGTTLTGYVDVNGTATSKQFPIGISSDNYTDDPSGANINANETATFSIYRDSSRTQLLDSSNFIINDTSTASNFEFLLVGGGGAGGPVSGQGHQGGGGGGAGGVKVASHPDIFDNNPTVWIGIGTGGTTIYPYQNGNPTYLRVTNESGNEIDSVGGGGRGGTDYGNGYNAPSGGGSGGGAGNGSNKYGGSGSTYGNDGGDTSSYCHTAGGGGAGGDGQNGTSAGADGGIGYDLTNFFSELAGDGYDGGDRIAGGGGGGRTEYYWEGSASCAGSSSAGDGRDGGGDGRLSNTQSNIHATPNTGGGGGGADGGPHHNYPSGSVFSNTNRSGGHGGSGIVYLKYTSETQLVGNWTGTASDHTVTSYDQSVAGGTKRTWIHKIIGDGALSLL